MYDKIARIIFDYTKNNKIADKKFVQDIIEIISNYNNLDDYINKIEISNSNDKFNNYNYLDQILTINIKETLSYCKNIFLRRKILFVNLTVALTIFHELDHVKLKKDCDINPNSIEAIFLNILHDIEMPKAISQEEYAYLTYEERIKLENNIKLIILDVEKRRICYELYHDMVPSERRANIISNIDLDNVMKKLYNTSLQQDELEKIMRYELKQFIKKCLYGYKHNYITNSPSIDYIEKVLNNEKINRIKIYDKDIEIFYKNAKSNYTLQERILYGLPLSINELKEINKESNPFKIYMKK